MKIVNYIDLFGSSGEPAAYFSVNDSVSPKGYTDIFDSFFAIQLMPERTPNKSIITELKIFPKDTKNYKSVTKILQWSLE